MHLLATLHRWWGVAFCLLFAMWFASGIVMHFVPYPGRREAAYPTLIDSSHASPEPAGTEISVSIAPGTVVLMTTRWQRVANYAGSIPHWLYETNLRHHRRAWVALVWWLSLIATIGAALGVILGLLSLKKAKPYGGMHRWHHITGLIFAPFLLTWIFSGFLSMDDGSLFGQSDALFRVLHKLDFEPLTSHPALRASVIVALCMCGLAFSVTGVVLAWRR